MTSGDLVELASGGATIRIDPADGGRIVSLLINGRERILQKSAARAPEPPIFWGCYAMVPWCGRLEDGRIPTGAGEVRIEPNLGTSAIHGLCFDRPWKVIERAEQAVTLECALSGRGWPFGGSVREGFRLSPTAIELELDVGDYTREGPLGVGWHPWFARPASGDLEVLVDAHAVLVLGPDMTPTGERRPITEDEDLRAGPVLGERRLDHVYVDTRSPAVVRWPDLELRIEHEGILTTVVHTPPEGVCVEPQTMWPNAPLLAARGVQGTGLRAVAPGERVRVAQRWTWRPR